MGIRRRGDRDDERRCHQPQGLGEIGEATLDAKALGARASAGAIAADKRDHLESRRTKRGHVHSTAERGTDHDRLQPVSPFTASLQAT
jgi:hypothetical protein